MTIGDYCPEFTRYIIPEMREDRVLLMVMGTKTPCGEAVVELIDKARAVPIDPACHEDFWYAIFQGACVLVYG